MSKMRNFPVVDRQLETMLFGAYSRYATERYREMKRRPSTLFEGAWGLARKLYADGDLGGAYAELQTAKRRDPDQARTLYFRTVEIEIARRLGHIDHAREQAMSLHGEIGDRALACFMVAATYEEDERLRWLNRLYPAGAAPLRKRDSRRPLDIHNLAADAPAVDGPMVSVIMPAFNAEDTIRTAARSVLEQTWRNIELIIADDCSTDGTWAVMQEIAASDDRVRTFQQPRNGGAYAARNTGLNAAKGEFVTVNDADDWSHPQRVEIQMRDLIDGHHFNTTHGAKVTADLAGVIKPRGGNPLVENTSSLLVRRAVALDLGGWDQVQFSADTEFYQRLVQHLGADERRLLNNTPMAFILSSPSSLTKKSATGLQSMHYGARYEYRHAAALWRATARSLRIEPDSRPFPIPRIAVERDAPVRLDTLLAADMTLPASVVALKEAKGRVGVLHIPHPRNFGLPYDPDVRALIHERGIEVVVPGQTVECDLVSIPDAECAKTLPDTLPIISAKICEVAGDANVSAFGAERVIRRKPIVTDLAAYRHAIVAKKLALLETEIRKLEARRDAKLQRLRG